MNSQLYMLDHPYTDDLPDCNLRDMFDQNVHSDDAAESRSKKLCWAIREEGGF